MNSQSWALVGMSVCEREEEEREGGGGLKVTTSLQY